jgi:hypothetical protein
MWKTHTMCCEGWQAEAVNKTEKGEPVMAAFLAASGVAWGKKKGSRLGCPFLLLDTMLCVLAP